MTQDSISKIKAESIHIVIPVHNRKTYTLACLQSLKKQSIRGFHIIVVDDGSTDGTSDAIHKEHSDITILKGDGNLWWSGAMNMGINHAINLGSKYIISLNDDLELSRDYIEKMVIWAEQMPPIIIGSYVFDINTKKPFSAGCRTDWRHCKVVSPLAEVHESKRHGIYQIDDATGRGLWIPTEIINKIGLFDAESLPQYGADNDFTLRAKKYGFQVYCNFDAVIFSHIEASGQLKYKQVYSFPNYFRHILGRKGTGNIKNFTLICLRHCPKKYFLQYFLYGITKRIGGYFINWAKHADWRGYARVNQ